MTLVQFIWFYCNFRQDQLESKDNETENKSQKLCLNTLYSTNPKNKHI